MGREEPGEEIEGAVKAVPQKCYVHLDWKGTHHTLKKSDHQKSKRSPEVHTRKLGGKRADVSNQH
jgi:hypothetical protein